MGLKNFAIKAIGSLKRFFKKPRKLVRRKTKKLKKELGSQEGPLITLIENTPPKALLDLKEIDKPLIQTLNDFSQTQLSPNTQRAYRRDLNDFLAFRLSTCGAQARDFFNLRSSDIATYREFLIQKGLKGASISRKLAVLKSFYNWAQSEQYILNNPAKFIKGFPQTQDSKTTFLDDAEISQLMGFLEAETLKRPESLTLAAHKLGIYLLLMLGLRRSEACALKWGHLEWGGTEWLINIPGKGMRERRLPIPAKLESVLFDWARRLYPEDAPNPMAPEREKLYFLGAVKESPILVSTRGASKDRALSSAELAHVVRRMGRKAGLLKRLHPHMLRATAVTHALDQGATHRGVQQMAGWTSPLMISRYDKRRNDPRLSAVRNLRYAQKFDSP